jgi:alkylation response protein AidB-like acyl-CoA dehydrogenase
LDLALAGAAGCVGALAECLEEVAGRACEAAMDAAGPLGRPIARMGVELEGARALVYAAAQLRAEQARNPSSAHLELEARTLVREAEYMARGAVRRAASRGARVLRSLGISESRSARRAAEAHACPLVAGPPQQAAIARYYLTE